MIPPLDVRILYGIYLAETQSESQTCGQAVLISLRNDLQRELEGKTVRWTVLSGEGHRQVAGMAPQARRLLFSAEPPVRGLSSAGRAPDLHSGGQEFDPPRLHQVRVGSSGG